MKTTKRIFIGLAVSLVLVFVFLLAAPVLFKDRIVASVKTTINESVNAEIDFADADVSFLRSFPDIALTVEDYRVIGIDTFAGLPLVRGESARVDLGFWSVIAGGGNYEIEGLTLTKPDINLLLLTPELANYFIVPDAESGADAGAVANGEGNTVITLQQFIVTDGSLIYDDRTTDTYLKLTGLDVVGRGDFTATVFDLVTTATADAFTFGQGGLNYLSEVKLDADAIVNIDSDQLKFTFRENQVKINELDLVFDGSIDMESDDDILFDLTYSAPANDFRQLWSMIPSAYTEGYERVQTGGTFTLAGDVKGTYNGVTETYPAFNVRSDIKGGSVQYPGRPVGITNIDAELVVRSPGSSLDLMVVSIPRLGFSLGGDPFQGSFRLATPLTDPDVDARLNGTIDLDKWASAIPLEGVSELGGRIAADITMNKVRQSIIDAGRYSEVDLAGDLLVSNLVYTADDSPPVRIAQAKAVFTPQFVDLQQFSATLGRSDISATAKINNILAYFSPEQTMRGSVTMRSNFFDADEWMVAEETSGASSPAELDATTATGGPTKLFDRFDFDVDAEIRELAYGEYRPKDIRVIGNIKPNKLEIGTATTTLKQSTFTASGVINNLFDYTFDEGLLTGDLSVRTGFFNVADFIDETAPAASAPSTNTGAAPPVSGGAIPVPRNINLRVDMNADRVQYTDITLSKVVGKMLVRDGAVVIEDGRADLLGGSMGFTGSYDTAEGEEAGFHFSYDIENFDFAQAFGVLNTFSILAPVGKFISGSFSSQLVMNGKLGDDLSPKLNTLDAKGLLRTAEARIASFKPLQVIGNVLNINELKETTSLKNIITAFEVNEGTVTVKPFEFTLAGIGMQMGGKHGLDMDMDYRIKAAVPRAMIQGNAIAGTALNALDKLSGQASKLGFKLSPGDTLNLNIGLTGSIANPRVAYDLLGTAGGGGDGSVVGAVGDAIKDRVQQELDDRKEQVRNELESKVDSARNLVGARAKAVEDSLRRAADAQAQRLQQEATNKLKGALGVKRDSTVADSLLLPGAAKDAVDEVKKELEKFNPFKRKKTGGGE